MMKLRMLTILLISSSTASDLTRSKDNDVAVPSNDMPCEPANADPVVPVSCDRDAEERERVLADDVEKQFNECVQEIQTPDPDQFVPMTRIRGNKTKKRGNEMSQIRSKGKASHDRPL